MAESDFIAALRRQIEEAQRAQMTHRTSSSSSDRPPTTLEDVGRGVSRGGAALAGMPVDLANMAMAGKGGEAPVGGSKWVVDKLHGMGVLPPEPETAGGKGAEFLTGLLDPTKAGAIGAAIGATKAVGGTAKALTKAAKVKAQGISEINARGQELGGLLGTVKTKVAMTPSIVMGRDPAFPGIHKNPKELVAEAASRVAPESPLLKQLFNVTRADQWEIAQQGRRKGNITDRPFKAAKTPRGAGHLSEVMTPENEGRLLDIISEAKKYPDLYQSMGAWYVMDPAYQHFVRLYGADKAAEAYRRYNTFTGMASPGSEVLTEINRGTSAHMMASQGRFDDWLKYAGVKESARGKDFPPELVGVTSHPYHVTAHGTPMQRYAQTGLLDMGSAKVPSYIHASGVPETGFQTEWPVGDAHWSRLVGLPDARPQRTLKGVTGPNNASASVPEMVSLGPWWKDSIAGKANLESVPAQAIVWGAGSGATGVTSPIGATKLELTAIQMGKRAKKLGISPEEVRDRTFLGQEYAGNIDPELLKLMGLTGGAGVAGAGAYNWYNQ
jgi:hypothetical protein